MSVSARFPIILIGLISLNLGTSSFRQKNVPETNEFQISFNFLHRVGIDPLVFDTMRYVNAFGNRYSVATLKYFISKISITRSNGERLIFNETHYIDAHDIKTVTFPLMHKISTGKYSEISFLFGLDVGTNVSGRFPNPPENKMEWPETMGGGYHYMKLEGKIDSQGEFNNYQAHTGQLNGIPYFIQVILPESQFTIDNKGVVIQIIMDINEWWRNPNTLDLNNITAIMDNKRIQQQLMANGVDVFSVGTVQ
jgi:hypothetical protein